MQKAAGKNLKEGTDMLVGVESQENGRTNRKKIRINFENFPKKKPKKPKNFF